MTEEIIINEKSLQAVLKQYDDLEQENKELKEKFEQYKKSKQKSYETLQKRLNDIEWENKELKELNKKICEDWEKEIKVYWNALEEIRELAEKSIEISYNLEVNSMLYDIKDKINEVLQCG
jgi:predicted nuclease with TOPRIM domain